VDWTWPGGVEQWIETIEQQDPRSTFFRYPNPRDPSGDVPKAVMKEARNIEETFESKEKQFIFVLEHAEGDSSIYHNVGSDLKEFTAAIEKAVDLFYGTHAALRAQVTCGS
jgi:hypothetical protein